MADSELPPFTGVYCVPGLSSDHVAPASPSEEDELPRLEEGRHIQNSLWHVVNVI